MAMPLSEAAVRATVDRAAAQFVKMNPQSVGISVGVYVGGNTYTYNYGATTPGGKQKPTSKTLYPIASVTKTFTGTLLADASLDGKMRLDDDVRAYLDGDYPNLEYRGHPVRIFDLIDHRSGLPFFIPDRPETHPDFVGNPQFVARVARIEATFTRDDFYGELHNVKLAGVPGETLQYSNAAAMLAGYILERVYGESYERLVSDKILRPLGMKDTAITLSPSLRARAIKGYDNKGDTMPDEIESLQGAGALRSDVSDLLKYAAWQIKEVDPEVRISHQARATSGNYSAGLNWQMLSDGGKRLIWQTGNFDGFHSYLIVEPELKIGMVVLFNETDDKSNPAHGEMVNAILKMLDADAIVLP